MNTSCFSTSQFFSLSGDDWKLRLPTSKACLEQFVCLTREIYGEKEMTYNTHLLLHIPDFVVRFGQLDFWSAFWAESFLGVLRRRFRGRSNLLQQAVNRINEVHTLYVEASTNVHSKRKSGVAFFLTNAGVVEAESVSSARCTGFLMQKVSDLYMFPLASSVHNIGYFVKTDTRVSTVIQAKCCAFMSEKG